MAKQMIEHLTFSWSEKFILGLALFGICTPFWSITLANCFTDIWWSPKPYYWKKLRFICTILIAFCAIYILVCSTVLLWRGYQEQGEKVCYPTTWAALLICYDARAHNNVCKMLNANNASNGLNARGEEDDRKQGDEKREGTYIHYP